MPYTFLASRGALLFILLLGFVSSLAIGAEFELVTSMEAGPGAPRPRRLELEELLSISGLFSVLLGAIAFFTRRTAVHERRARKLVEEAALRDPLTGLSNRRLFNDRLQSALARERGGNVPCAVLLIDLDRFKQVNDSFGHLAGDRLLVEIGERIRSCASEAADAARLGGDEFAVILRGKDAAEARAQEIVRELESTIRRPVEIAGKWIYPGASIGLAFGTAQLSRSSDLLEAADRSMYGVKKRNQRPIAA